MWVLLVVLLFVVVVVGVRSKSSSDGRGPANPLPPTGDESSSSSSSVSGASSALFRDSHLWLPTMGPVRAVSPSFVRCTPMVEIRRPAADTARARVVGLLVDLDAGFDRFARYELRGPAKSVRFGLSQTSVQKTESRGPLDIERSSVHEITVEDDPSLRTVWKADSGYVRLFYTHLENSPFWDIRSLRGNLVRFSDEPMEFRLLDSATTEAHTLVVNHRDRYNTIHPISAKGIARAGIRHVHLIPRTETTVWYT